MQEIKTSSCSQRHEQIVIYVNSSVGKQVSLKSQVFEEKSNWWRNRRFYQFYQYWWKTLMIRDANKPAFLECTKFLFCFMDSGMQGIMDSLPLYLEPLLLALEACCFEDRGLMKSTSVSAWWARRAQEISPETVSPWCPSWQVCQWLNKFLREVRCS